LNDIALASSALACAKDGLSIVEVDPMSKEEPVSDEKVVTSGTYGLALSW